MAFIIQTPQTSRHGCIIRRLGLDDATHYHEIRLRMLSEHPSSFVTSLEDVAGKPVESVLPSLGLAPGAVENAMLGAFDEQNMLIGVAGLRVSLRRQERHRGTVVSMFVDSVHAGRGVGTALMRTLICEAESIPFLEQLHLRVTVGNEAAIRLYVRAGFIPAGIEVRATKSGITYYDALHMHRPLRTSVGLVST
jgi:ribosomal protein S18 acetylase RimI-like enzyme